MLFLILISISQNKKQERVYPKGILWSINPKAIGNVFIVVVEMLVTQSFQWHPQNSKVLCSVSAPSLVWVSNKDGGASCPCSPQCMDSYHYLEDTEWCKVYLLEFINFIFFDTQETEVVTFCLLGMCPSRGHYILPLSWKSFLKIFTELFPVIIWVWLKCLSSEMPFLTPPPHVLPMSLLPEIQMRENKIPCERSFDLNMA